MGALLERLSSRPKIGGLQVSGSSVSYVLLEGEPRMASARLAPGVLDEGRIVDRAQLLSALLEVRGAVGASPRDHGARVVVSLSAEIVYTQSFDIPNVGEERRGESVNLNLQMISPIPKGEAYMASELLRETPDRYEFLGAFAAKKLVDDYRSVLEEAGFAPVAFEFPSLSLTRLIVRARPLLEHSTLVLQLSSDGLDFFIIKWNCLYFDYFRSWRSIQGDQREISRALFDRVVTEEVQKVVNFSLGRFKETPQELLLIAPGFEGELKTFLESKFPFKVTSFALADPYTPQWYGALGAAMRSAMERGEDRAITLAPLTPIELFYEEQLIDFVRLWRNIAVGVLALLLLFFGGAAYFLSAQARAVRAQLSGFNPHVETAEFNALAARAEEFNRLVAAVGAARSSAQPWHLLFKNLETLAASRGVVIDRLVVGGTGQSTTLVARAPSNERVLEFKDALASAPGFSETNLLVSQIATLEDNTVGFTVVFKVDLAALKE